MERHELKNGRLCLWLCLLAFGVVFADGCGRSSERRSIEGSVTFDGKPLEKGHISFRPQSGTASPSAGSEIVDGRFSIAPAGGVLPGKFRVEITASRVTGQKIRDPIRGMVPEVVQYIPTKYNTQSQLEIVIPPESDTVAKDFELAN